MMVRNWPCGILSSSVGPPRQLPRSAWLALSFSSPGLAQCLAGAVFQFVGLFFLTGATLAQTVPNAASVAPAAKAAPAQTNTAAPAAQAANAPWQLVATIKLPNPGPASLDRRGTLYVADADNNLRQFGRDGQSMNTYSPPQPGHVAQVEAWNLTQTLLFYDDRQQLVLLDRFLIPISQIRLADYLPDATIRAATLAPDGRLWLLDESTLTLRTLDPQTGFLPQNTPLDLLIGRARPDFRFLRQYQNNLYLVDHASGIFVFDNLGNYQKKLPFSGLSYVGFRGDELYYYQADGLHLFDLYKLQERRLAWPAGLTDPAGVRQVVLSEDHAYLVTATGVLVYQLH